MLQFFLEEYHWGHLKQCYLTEIGDLKYFVTEKSENRMHKRHLFNKLDTVFWPFECILTSFFILFSYTHWIPICHFLSGSLHNSSHYPNPTNAQLYSIDSFDLKLLHLCYLVHCFAPFSKNTR